MVRIKWIEVNGRLVLVEVDTESLSEEAKREVSRARKEIAEGGGKSWDDIKKELGL